MSTLFGAFVVSAFLILSAFSQSTAPDISPVLMIETEPATTVFIDGIRFGKTDQGGKLTVRGLSRGRHVVQLRADGFSATSKAAPPALGVLRIPLSKTSDPSELAFQEAERSLGRDRQLAAEAYRKAIKLKPSYTDAYIGLARSLSDSGDPDGALKTLRDLRRFAPANAEASAVEGRIYKDNGDEEKAVAAFKRSIAQGRGFQPEAYTGLGLLYKDKAEAAGNFSDEAANYAEASKDLTIALKQLSGAPDSLVLYQLLGLVYEKQKKFDEAIKVYNEFLTRFPDSTEAPTIRSFIEQIKKQKQ